MTEKPRGRPRSADAHRSILEATGDLLLRDGYDRLSIERIAARAGVGKQTVYRWWPSKAAIVAEAVLDGYIPVGAVPLAATDDLRADLQNWVEAITSDTAAVERASLTIGLAAASAGDAESAQQLGNRLFDPERQTVVERLQTAVDAGRVRPDIDLTVVADALFGAILLRALTRQPATKAWARGVLDLILDGVLTAQ
jgi:AcrR family transcriptional regulator